MSTGRRETVIVVHGTFAAPKSNVTSWFQRATGASATHNFIDKLDDALQKRGSAARCWAHCSGGRSVYTWSGANNWAERASASTDLAALIDELETAGWSCHIVAHSHGGNLVADALARVRRIGGSVTTLGTPFVDAMAPVVERVSRSARFFYLFFALSIPTLYATSGSVADEHRAIWFAALACLMTAGWLDLPYRLWLRARKLVGHRQSKPGGKQAEMLCINSDFDEAWQLLHHVRNTDNPARPQQGLLRYLIGFWSEFTSNDAKIARLHGTRAFRDLDWDEMLKAGLASAGLLLGFYAVPVALIGQGPESNALRDQLIGLFGSGNNWSFLAALLAGWIAVGLIWSGLVLMLGIANRETFSAALSPARWCLRQVRAVVSLPNAIGIYMVRRRAWSLLQEAVLGFAHYPHNLPQVVRTPPAIEGRRVYYESMPQTAETFALEARNAWLLNTFGAASSTFSRLAVTSADLTSLLRTIENDSSLVHAAYYESNECIERIADWIAHRR